MKVLIAVDGSPTALRALRFLTRLVRSLDRRHLTLIYVRPSHTGAFVGLGAPGPLLEETIADVEREVLAEACGVLREAGLDADTLVETGPPAPAICRVATEGAYDLVVLGSRGHGELKSLLVGSTSDAVIHAAPCPVLVVR